jgi:hypothetical protein
MTDLPPEAAGRLKSGPYSSGLSVPDFAACLQMGMRPVGLVQGYCVMRWSWYAAAGNPYSAAYSYPSRRSGGSLSSYRCPHQFGYGPGIGGARSADHRSWGENFEQPGVTQAWSEGFNNAYRRMVEEAQDAGAHGIIGVIDTSRPLIENGIREFHIYGTAVVVDGAPPPENIWTCYLAGQRLAKLIEAGLMPLAVVASFASVRVWAVCATEILLRGGYDGWGVVQPVEEITQMAEAQMQARRRSRDHIKALLGRDALHGATMDANWREIGEGDYEIDCTLRGTRVRRFKATNPLPTPLPTVSLA